MPLLSSHSIKVRHAVHTDSGYSHGQIIPYHVMIEPNFGALLVCYRILRALLPGIGGQAADDQVNNPAERKA